MKLLTRKDLVLEGMYVDEIYGFSIGFTPALNCHVIIHNVNWFIPYNRFTYLTKEGFKLYCNNPDEFRAIHYGTSGGFRLSQYATHVLGAQSLREYCCNPSLPTFASQNSKNSWRGYVYDKGVLWAYIETDDRALMIPPRQLDLESHPEITPIMMGADGKEGCVAHGIWIDKITQ